MTRFIHETYSGTDLTIPTANDLFSVQATAAPNGNSAIRIAGQSGATDMQAYVSAPTMSPNLFKVRSYNWSVSCWFRCNGNANHGGPLFGVQNASSTGAINANNPLRIDWGGINSISLTLYYWGASGNLTIGRSTNDNSGGKWLFVVFRVPSPGQMATSIIGRTDGALETGFSNAMIVPAAGADTFGSSLEFVIGRHTVGAVGTMYTNPDWCKLTFHNHLLTLTECQMLWESMMP